MVRLIARLALTLWFVLVFRLTIGPRIAIAGVQPDLAAALVFYVTIVYGPLVGILGGFGLGLLVDVDRPHGLGLTSLAWSTMAYVTSRIRGAVDTRDPIIASALLTFLVLIAEAVRSVALAAADPGRFAFLLVRWALPTAAYTGAIVPLLVWAAHGILGETRWLRGRP